MSRPPRSLAIVRAIRELPARTSLRMKLVGASLLLVALALLVSDAAGTRILRHYLVQRLDAQLQTTTRSDPSMHPHDNDRDDQPSTTAPGTAANSTTGSSAPPGNQGTGQYGRPGPALSSSFFRGIFEPDGTARSALRLPSAVDQTSPKLPLLDSDAVAARHDRPFTVPSSDGNGSPWRVVAHGLPDGSSLVIAIKLSDVDATVQRLVTIDLGIGAIALGILGALAYVAVRGSLRRLVEVERTAEAIAAGDLSHRVPGEQHRTEVGRLAGALNTMLGNIERAFAAQRASEAQARASEERMRRFVADAGHELRTPLTSIRGFAELSRTAPAVADDLPALLGRIENEAQRMGVLVNDLLLLARLDQHPTMDEHAVDVVALAIDVAADAPAVAPEHHVRIDFDEDDEQPHPVVLGDELRLLQAVRNLVMNAYVHTPAGTNVTVEVRTQQDEVTVAVRDDGPGMDPEDAARAFERFYRADPARARATGGSGLGLAIAWGIVHAHGGRIDLATAPGAGATFTIHLPRYQPS